MNYFLRNLFRRLTPHEITARELQEVKRARYRAICSREHAASVVSYQDDRIIRLTRMLTETDADL